MISLETVLQKLYESEIDCAISSFWDSGWDVSIGNEANGFLEIVSTYDVSEIAGILDELAKKHFPDSKYTRENTT